MKTTNLHEIEHEKNNDSNKKSLKRIASLDFQRGLAIWMMVFLHVFNHIYDFSWVDIGTIFNDAPVLFALFVIMAGFFGGWAGYFLLISSVVNSYTMTKRAQRGQNLEKSLVKQVFTGIGILVAGRMAEGFGYYGYFGRVFRSGNSLLEANTWNDPIAASFIWRRIFMLEALQIIGWSMIIMASVHYLLMRNGGFENLKKNIAVYASLAILVLILSPFIWLWIDNLNWFVPPESKFLTYGYTDIVYYSQWPSEFLQAENASITTYFCVLLAGDLYPFFPFLSTSFIGALFGLALAQPKPSTKIPLLGLIITLAIFSIGIFAAIFMGLEVTFERPDIAYYCFLLGTQFGIMTLLLWLVEFRGKSQSFGNNIVVKYFRIWGTLALTIFVLQIYSIVPRAILNPLFQMDLMSGRFSKEEFGIVFFFAFLTVLFYDLLIWLWAKINFKWSFEWIIVHLTAKFSKMDASSRLNFKEILNEVHWLDFKELSKKD